VSAHDRGKLPRFLDHFKLDASSLLYWGLLTLLLLSYVLLIYVIVVSIGFQILGEDPEGTTPWWLDGIAFGAIAVGFLPVSRWLSMRINELVYGEHDNPYTLIARLNGHLQAMTNPAATLPLLTADIASELRLPYVAIRTANAEPALCYETGTKPEGRSLTHLSIYHLDEQVGVLTAAPRRRDQSLSASDLHLLRDITRQIGVALYAARLTAEVQRARERLVMIREEERRRIRNDLHDGLGPTLSSLQLQLGGVRRLIHTDPALAESTIEEMKDDLRKATAEIRRLVYDLRPPLLDELGLVEALKSLFGQNSSLDFEVLVSDPTPSMTAAVEVAIFRIASEAVHNVVKHADATRCTLSIEQADEHLYLLITDDGHGLPGNLRYGVGFNSMRERAEELGGTMMIKNRNEGGAQLAVWLPMGGSQGWKDSLF
jgi:two-component system NarL family sensor kinase